MVMMNDAPNCETARTKPTAVPDKFWPLKTGGVIGNSNIDTSSQRVRWLDRNWCGLACQLRTDCVPVTREIRTNLVTAADKRYVVDRAANVIEPKRVTWYLTKACIVIGGKINQRGSTHWRGSNSRWYSPEETWWCGRLPTGNWQDRYQHNARNAYPGRTRNEIHSAPLESGWVRKLIN